MAKSGKKTGARFALGMVIYALVFLLITAAGLAVFWNFIEAYELSRPRNTVDAYVAGLSEEKLHQKAQSLLSDLDSNIRSEEESMQVILDSIGDRITYAKKTGESSEQQQVYVLKGGRQVIGQVTITAGEPDIYGFTRWTATESSFDFSYLLSEPVSVTVPEDFQVSINGKLLDENYITETGIGYPALEDFAEDYDLPEMVTYTADRFLGNLLLEVAGRNGESVILTSETDMNSLIPTCSEQEQAEIEPVVKEFLNRYVAFTGSSNKAVGRNFSKLKEYMVPGGALEKRLATAVDGLKWSQSAGDTIKQVTMNHYYDLGEEGYLCDVTYILETIGKKGAVETTNNMKLILVSTDKGLKVEALSVY